MPWLLLFLLGSTLAVLSLGSAPSRSQTPHRIRKLVLLGDSIAVGLLPHMRTWAKHRSMTLAIDAKIGRRVSEQEATAVAPDSLVFVSLGSNGGSPRAVHDLVREIRRRKATRVIWLLPPAIKSRPDLPELRAAILSSGVETVQAPVPLGDGIHPRSYAETFRAIAPALT